MPLREVKNRLSEVVDRVAGQHDRVVITRHGRPAAVGLSPDDLASLEETLEVMGRPRLLADIRESLATEGEVMSKKEILAALGR